MEKACRVEAREETEGRESWESHRGTWRGKGKVQCLVPLGGGRGTGASLGCGDQHLMGDLKKTCLGIRWPTVCQGNPAGAQ